MSLSRPSVRTLVLASLATIAVAAVGCSPGEAESAPKAQAVAASDIATSRKSEPVQRPARTEVAVFAGGCFWSVEKAFEGVPGVVSAVSGFTGGRVQNPTYAQVVRGGTGHVEAVQVTFDPSRVSYRTLVDRFWRSIDPTDPDGQFCDQGPSYVTAVYVTPGQRAAAQESRSAAAAALEGRMVTPIRPAQRFWPAGREHQDYARRNPAAYRAYEVGCRRAQRLAQVWG
ncbi:MULTISPECIES: peptide-methionine (S)-S-oxide reductase MsrA [Brevundimonas]|uniref:peptide-methionine (S)-S-oxide reductase MsrA n=1 Tax=Brevundimonas TaxID=41275 RepID=UPI000F0326F8|nr:peptide-methionine (S)-S-oxide reductase MsrA [Brevundimonas lutea]